MFAKSLITRGASASTGEGVPEPGDNWDNKSLVLNGQNQYVVCCNTAVQTELQKASGGGRLFKLHFWFKRTASRNTSQDEQTLWNNGDVDANKILSIFIDDQGTEIKIRKGDGSGVSVSSSGLNITNDQWHHLEVGILDNGHKLVLDGDYANLYSGTDVWASDDSSEMQYIGANNNTGTPANFFPGQIAHYDVLNNSKARTSAVHTATNYNGGELFDVVSYAQSMCIYHIKFGDGARGGFRDGDNNELLIDHSHGYEETDLMQGNGLLPGVTSSAWTLGGNWTAISEFLQSDASNPDGSSDVLSYNTTGDYELTVGWLYQLKCVTQSNSEAPSGTGSTDPESSVTFAGHEIINADGWSVTVGTYQNWLKALNTNDFTFTSFSDADSAANSILAKAMIYKPNKIAYFVGGSRASSIVRDIP